MGGDNVIMMQAQRLAPTRTAYKVRTDCLGESQCSAAQAAYAEIGGVTVSCASQGASNYLTFDFEEFNEHETDPAPPCRCPAYFCDKLFLDSGDVANTAVGQCFVPDSVETI